jgi:DHA2 family lincomycin resistance protein-like MFS transporter
MSTVTATIEARASQALPRQARTVIATLLVAAFVVILNETIMGVALPRLMTELHIAASTVQWLSTAFMLTMAVVIPTTGFMLQRISTRTVFIIAMSLFCTGTLVAGLAPGFWLLLPARIIQASGTAMMIPLLMTSILTLVPIERRGLVMGNVSIAISVAPAIGPTLSGLILQFLSWRFMFLLVLPIALVALAIGARLLQKTGERGHQRLDIGSVLLSIPAFGGIVYGLSRFAVSSGTGIGIAVGALAVGIVCLVLFGWRQIQLQRSGDPLLDLRAFKIKMFSVSVALLCIAMMALFGALILLPIYLQSIRGPSSLETGFLLLPGGLLMGLLAPTVGRIFDKYGPKVLDRLRRLTGSE